MRLDPDGHHPEPQGEEPPATPRKPEPQELRREITDFVKLVIWFLVIFVGMRTYVIEGYEVQGTSMVPTLESNERILVFKLPHILSRLSLFSWMDAVEPGDIVVFDSPDATDKRYVKRVIAVGPDAPGGNTVSADSAVAEGPATHVRFHRGEVWVDNKRVDEPYLQPEATTSRDTQTLDVRPGEYYVLGDNRPGSKDSRSFNAINDKAVIGKAVLRFWPPSRITFFP